MYLWNLTSYSYTDRVCVYKHCLWKKRLYEPVNEMIKSIEFDVMSGNGEMKIPLPWWGHMMLALLCRK